MVKAKNILNNLRRYKYRVGKSNCCSGDEFKVTLIRKDNGKKMSFTFHDNMYNDADTERMLECLIMDRMCYVDFRTYKDFCYNMGYDLDSEESKRVYHGCRKEAGDLSRFFTRKELEVLASYYLL